MKNLLIPFIMGILVAMHTTSARSDTVYLHLPVTKHLLNIPHETENTLGVGWTRSESVFWSLRPIGGFYRNSGYELSLYAGLYKSWKMNDWIDYSVGVLIITGYDWAPILPTPVAFIEVWRFRAVLVPGVFNLTLDILEW